MSARRALCTCSAIVVGLLAVAGCTSTISGSAESNQGQPAADAPTTTAPSLPDRPDGPVVAALRGIDACALFDPAAITNAHLMPGDSAATGSAVPQKPHLCDYNVGDGATFDMLTIRLGDDLGIATGLQTPKPLTVAGAKAYLYDANLNGPEPQCEVFFPVSSDLAISVQAVIDDKKTNACTAAEAVAAGVPPKLTNLASVAVNPNTRPLGAWDGCTLLADVLKAESKHTSTTLGSDLDTCEAGDQSITVDYSRTLGDPNSEQVRVGNAVGYVDSGSQTASPCTLAWSLGPAGPTYPVGTQVEVDDEAGNCPQAATDGTKIQSLILGPAPTATSVQQPLLYPAG